MSDATNPAAPNNIDRDWQDYVEWKEDGFQKSVRYSFMTDEAVNPFSFCDAENFPRALDAAYLHIKYVGNDFGKLSNLIETIHESGLSQLFWEKRSRNILRKLEIDLRGYRFYALEAARYLDEFSSLEDKYQAQGDIPALATEMRNLIEGASDVLFDQLKELRFSDYVCVERILTLLAAA